MAQLKSTSVTGNLSVTGNVVASQIIKLDGTSDHILMSNGGIQNLNNFNHSIIFKQNNDLTNQYNINNVNLLTATNISIISSNLNDSAYDRIYVGKNNNCSLQYRTKREFLKDLNLTLVYNFKGTVNNINALKNISSANIGDVYSILDTGDNWACHQAVSSATNDNYQNYWSNLGKNVDLSGYMTLDTNQTISGQKTFTNVLKIETHNNTVTFGSLNDGFCHIYNTAAIPFIFNNSVASTNGNLGTSAYPWNNLYLSGTIMITDKTFTFPVDSGGTLATQDWYKEQVFGDKNSIPKFTGTNTLENSNITDDGTNIIFNGIPQIAHGKFLAFQPADGENESYHTGVRLTYKTQPIEIVPLRIYGTCTSEGWHGLAIGNPNLGLSLVAKTYHTGLYDYYRDRWLLHHEYDNYGTQRIEFGTIKKGGGDPIPTIKLNSNVLSLEGNQFTLASNSATFTYNTDDKCIDVTFS